MVFKSKGLRFLGFISSKISPSDSPFFLLLLFSPPPPSSFSESRWFSYPQDFLGFCFIFPTPPPRIFLTFLVVFLPNPQGFAGFCFIFPTQPLGNLLPRRGNLLPRRGFSWILPHFQQSSRTKSTTSSKHHQNPCGTPCFFMKFHQSSPASPKIPADFRQIPSTS